MKLEGFQNVVHNGWVSCPTQCMDSAKNISAKFKNMRKILKVWQFRMTNLKANIANVKLFI